MSESPQESLTAGGLLGGGKKRRRFLWLMGVALYVGVVWYIGWGQIGGALLSVNPVYFALFVASMVNAFLVRALKWWLVLGRGQNAVGLLFLSKVGGGLSPGRLGELAPLMLPEHRTPRMGAWIALDRLLETAATLGLGIFGLMALGLPQPGIIATFLAAVLVLVIAPFYVLTRRRWFLWVASKTGEQSLPHRVAMMIAAVSDEIFTFGKKVPLASAITLVATCNDILTAMLLYLCFGYKVSFAMLATVQCAHGIAAAVPFMPNASGVPYFAAAFLLHKLAGIPEAVLAASVGISVTMSNVLLWSCFGLTAGSLRRSRPTAPLIERQHDQGALFNHLASRSCLYAYDSKALNLIDALVPEKGRVLDVGCGDGTIAHRFEADSVTGFDISPKCAALAREAGLNTVVADARGSFPFQPATFDTVYCVDVLHHIEQA
ncbi:MAG: flippase-like domain-containing protein, partial [Nitrospiraceae bacterium]|nr:flippase-like domain-containing protein [Nitrospiraceae bacterium]